MPATAAGRELLALRLLRVAIAGLSLLDAAGAVKGIMPKRPRALTVHKTTTGSRTLREPRWRRASLMARDGRLARIR